MTHAWHRRGRRLQVDSAGQNRRVPVFGALDAMTGHVTAMITEHKRSDDFIAFLEMLVDHVYADRRHVYLFLDNCSIHHTQAVRQFLHARRDRLTVIWNARYATNLNLIERFWGHLKQNAFHNYFFGSVRELESAIMQAVQALNRDDNHPLRLNLQTAQTLVLQRYKEFLMSWSRIEHCSKNCLQNVITIVAKHSVHNGNATHG